jgi:hypothetical protein
VGIEISKGVKVPVYFSPVTAIGSGNNVPATRLPLAYAYNTLGQVQAYRDRNGRGKRCQFIFLCRKKGDIWVI